MYRTFPGVAVVAADIGGDGGGSAERWILLPDDLLTGNQYLFRIYLHNLELQHNGSQPCYNNRHGSDYGAPPPSNYSGDDTYSGAPTSHTHHAGSYQADAYAATVHGHHSNAVGYSHGGVGYGGGREGGGYGGGGGDGGYGGSGSGTVALVQRRKVQQKRKMKKLPCFSLINKATNLAMKHAKGDKQHDFGDGYRAMRMVNNIRLNVDALNGDKQSGGVHDGTNLCSGMEPGRQPFLEDPKLL
ncbi:keratin, type I cytoskeletal 10-like [Pistacia vera]|uniref:keratin, type I cytoskeletal 10-like n=1 Tax=Pistacia vera TaxID=55513 RepID=UPI001263DC24|nr:keratin, type I cytoskeletal 10-like [Pistacia vera]